MVSKNEIFPIGIGTWKVDYEKLNNFESEEFNNVKIDWYGAGEGVTIDQLPNQF